MILFLLGVFLDEYSAIICIYSYVEMNRDEKNWARWESFYSAVIVSIPTDAFIKRPYCVDRIPV